MRTASVGMARGLEAAHGAFPLPRWLMGVFSAIIQPLVLPVLDPRQDLPLRCTITGKFIRYDHPRHVLASLKQLAEELFGRLFVASALHQNIEYSPMLVDGPPQIGRLAIDREEDFIEVPFIPSLRTSTFELVRIVLPELQSPAPHGLIAEGDTASRHQFFDIPKTQRKPEIQPDRMRNDFGRVAVTLVGWGSNARLHAESIAHIPVMSDARRFM